MKIIKKYERQGECHHCGVLLSYNEKDMHIGKNIKSLMAIFIICPNCKCQIEVSQYLIPHLILRKFEKLYYDAINAAECIEEIEGNKEREEIKKEYSRLPKECIIDETTDKIE